MGTAARIIAIVTFIAAAIAGSGFNADAQAATPSGGQPLVSRLTGQCLTAVTLQQQACQGTANQQWRLQAVNGTLYFWVNDSQSGQCLDVTVPDNRVVQDGCDGRPSQRWTLWPSGGENYRLVNFVATGGADLEAVGDTVKLGQWQGDRSQLWTVTRTPAPQTKTAFRSEDRGTYWVGQYAIVNPDDTVLRDWVLEFDLTPGAWMGQYWNGVATISGTHVTVRPSPANATVAPGGSTTPADFGFAALGVQRTPTACKINGRPCAGPVPALRPPNVNVVTATQAGLFWLPPADAVAKYELSRNGAVLPGVPPLAMSFLDSGLASGTSYTYRLRIWTPDGRVSLFSPEITVTTTK